jgi:hypothetical protein
LSDYFLIFLGIEGFWSARAEPPCARASASRRFSTLTKIDHWFLVQIKEIVDFEEELAEAKN